MDNDDKIGEFLELEPLKKDITKAKDIVKASKLDNDFEYARGNLYQVIEHGSNALAELLEVANTLSDANMTLLDLTKKKQDVNNDAGGRSPNTVNNNLFVGSTGELQKLIKKNINEPE